MNNIDTFSQIGLLRINFQSNWSTIIDMDIW